VFANAFVGLGMAIGTYMHGKKLSAESTATLDAHMQLGVSQMKLEIVELNARIKKLEAQVTKLDSKYCVPYVSNS